MELDSVVMLTQNTEPDVHSERPEVGLWVEQAGYSEIEKIVKVAQEDEDPLVLSANFEVYVDLPEDRLGVDMSRNIQALNETLEEIATDPTATVDSICERAAEHLFEKHDYTSRAQVEMDGKYVASEMTPESDLPNEEAISIVTGAVVGDDKSRKKIGVEVPGMLACPCTQGASEQRARKLLEEFDVDESQVETFLDQIPQMTHSQCSCATLMLEGEDLGTIDFRDLIEIAHRSMSSRVYNTLKRTDEDHIVRAAHEKPRVTEDSIRLMAQEVDKRFSDLPDETVVTLEEWSDESIHQHNARSQRSATLGKLQSELR